MDVKMRGTGNVEEWMTTKAMTAIEDGKGDLVNIMQMTPRSVQAEKRKKSEGEGQGDILGREIEMATWGAGARGVTTRSSTDLVIERSGRAGYAT
jgi:hypothetical protein